jgi:hypothetical protein
MVSVVMVSPRGGRPSVASRKLPPNHTFFGNFVEISGFLALGSLWNKSRPSVEQRRPVHRLFREIDQFRVDLHPSGLAVRPDVSDRLSPVHVVERACARHLDAGQRRIAAPEPAVAMRAKVHGDDIAAVGLAVMAHCLARQDLEILVAHEH